MNPEALRTEYELALDATLESDAQVREALQLSAKAQGDNATMTAIDMARIVSTTLALNERLHEQAERHRAALERLEVRARIGAGITQAGV